MNYAAIKKTDVANGSGVRVSLFVSGCTHACKGCFNSEAWDFCYGQPFTEETEAEIEELQAQLSAGADYQALMDLTAKLDAATARRDDLYARWENASEELAAGEEEV